MAADHPSLGPLTHLLPSQNCVCLQLGENREEQVPVLSHVKCSEVAVP